MVNVQFKNVKTKHLQEIMLLVTWESHEPRPIVSENAFGTNREVQLFPHWEICKHPRVVDAVDFFNGSLVVTVNLQENSSEIEEPEMREPLGET